MIIEEPKSVFDQVVCVNLDRRPDRWSQFCQRLQKIDWSFLTPDRFSAIDGNLCRPPNWWTQTSGAWGCLQSHISILENALQNGINSILVFEDDADFIDEFSNKVLEFLADVPDDWDQIYLGGQHLSSSRIPPIPIGPKILRCKNVNRTHAYAVRGIKFITEIYRHLQDYPSHARTPRHHVDHRLGILHGTDKYNIYAPRKWLVGQVGGPSDVLKRQTRAQFWHLRSLPGERKRNKPKRSDLINKKRKTAPTTSTDRKPIAGAAGVLSPTQRILVKEKKQKRVLSAINESIKRSKQSKTTIKSSSWNSVYSDARKTTLFIATSNVTQVCGVKTYFTRSIKGQYPYVFIGEFSFNLLFEGETRNTSVLVAAGLTSSHKHEAIGVAEVTKNEREYWLSFLRRLREFGLRDVRLIITNRCLDLNDSLEAIFPRARLHLGSFELSRSLIKNTPRGVHKTINNMFRIVYSQDSRANAMDKAAALVKILDGNLFRKRTINVNSEIAKSLYYYDFPRRDWSRIQSMNYLRSIVNDVKKEKSPIEPASREERLFDIIAVRLLQANGAH